MGSVNASLKVEEVYLSVAYTKTIENKPTLRGNARACSCVGRVRFGVERSILTLGLPDRDPTESIEHSSANIDFDECADIHEQLFYLSEPPVVDEHRFHRGDDRINCARDVREPSVNSWITREHLGAATIIELQIESRRRNYSWFQG